jgi:lysophospholipase L1-like esterase
LIKAYCENNPHLFYIDSTDQYLGKDGRPVTSLYRDDKLHYNEDGYKVWGKAIRKKVKVISGQ